MTEIIKQKAWYVIYTKSRTEKKVKIELDFQEIENYLPIQKRLQQWSDRKKWVEFPLISGYVFVYITPFEFEKVLRTPGMIGFVKAEGLPAVIPNEQIDSLKRLLQQNEVSFHVDYKLYKAGDEIEVIRGPLLGMRGRLITVKGKKKVAIQLDQVSISVHIEVSLEDIVKLNKEAK
jgi:transcription antitermination factor NusG